MLTKSELRKLASKEKKSAAIHEASHAALVFKFGGYARARIWRNTSGDAYEKAWLGQCDILGEPGTVEMSAAHIAQFKILAPPANWEVLVGLAGVVGERLFADDVSAESIFDEIELEMMCGDEISATDLQMIGDAIVFDDVALVVELLDAMRAEIMMQVESLLSAA